MKIIGKNINLVKVSVDDASFILSLRTDPNLSQFLSPVENDMDKQKLWLQKALLRKDEYYYLIKNKKNIPIGTIRIYDVKDNIFCWGSWIVIPKYRKYASFESIFLLYKFAFVDLGFSETNFDVRKENEKALNFYLRFGAKVVSEDDQDYFLNYKKEYFFDQRSYYESVIDNINL